MSNYLYSFDIFDTLITRTTATPKGIFALIQKELQNSAYDTMDRYVRDNFYYLRISAETVARNTYAKNGVEDIRLTQIYEGLAAVGSLSESEIKLLMDLECRLEEENAVGIWENIDRLKKLVSENKQVVLISDMYLDSHIIRKILCRIDSVFLKLPLYVSGECGKSKWFGNLYDVVREAEGASFGNWTHCGDHIRTDIKKAGEKGIKTQLYPYEKLLAFEEKTVAARESDSYIQLAVGTSRNIRMNGVKSEPRMVGSSLGANILYPYVAWLLQRSAEQNINRLYFIARDGFILKEIADRIIKEYHYDIETHYLYGSRRAWRFPAADRQQFSIKEIFARSYKATTVDGLADLLMISAERLFHLVPLLRNLQGKILTQDILSEIMDILTQDEKFLDYIYGMYKEKRAKVCDYLKQEINLSDGRFAFVDLAGSGFTQGCLAAIMKDFYDGEIQTFFYRLDEIKAVKNCKNIVFYPNYIPQFILFEMLCRAPHGQTEDYSRNQKGKMIPVFSEGDKEKLEAHGVPAYLDAVREYASQFARLMYQNQDFSVHLELAVRYISFMAEKPDELMLRFLGDMPDNAAGWTKEAGPVAPRLSKQDLRNIFLLRTGEPVETFYKGNLWEYSLKRLTEKDKRRMEFYQKHRDTFYGKSARRAHKIKTIAMRGRKKNDVWNKPVYATRYDLIADRIVIYGAGKRGRLLYNQLKKQPRYQIILWADSAYEQYQKESLPVSSPEEIKNLDCDQIVIAVLSRQTAAEIKKNLTKKGIPEQKILWVPPRKK